MPQNDIPVIDWSLTTREGAEREQLRRWWMRCWIRILLKPYG